MKHELKIIIKCESEHADGKTHLPTNSGITIYLDNEPIGVIQKFKLEADCKKICPTIEFDFLNFDDPNIDPSYFNKEISPSGQPPYMYQYTKKHTDKLSAISGIKINLRNLFDENINEVGTDGIIDKIIVDK